jgi:hypothetical protein
MRDAGRDSLIDIKSRKGGSIKVASKAHLHKSKL